MSGGCVETMSPKNKKMHFPSYFKHKKRFLQKLTTRMAEFLHSFLWSALLDGVTIFQMLRNSHSSQGHIWERLAYYLENKLAKYIQNKLWRVCVFTPHILRGKDAMRYLQGRMPENSLQGNSTEDAHKGHRKEEEMLHLWSSWTTFFQ